MKGLVISKHESLEDGMRQVHCDYTALGQVFSE